MSSENAQSEDADAEGQDTLSARRAQQFEAHVPVARPRGDARGGDERRRKRGGGGERRSSSGYGDGVERATCIFYRHTFPPEFPVYHRPGLATSRPTEVDRRPGAVLLCDQNHDGECLWPDGDSVAKTGSVLLPAPETVPPSSATSFVESNPDELGTDERHPEPAGRDAAEQAGRAQSENSRDDQDWYGSGITDEH
jgi:hypothetical protein